MEEFVSVETSEEESDNEKHDKQPTKGEIRRNALVIIQDCASTLLKKRYVKTAYVRWSLQRSPHIILWDLYCDEKDYCGCELTPYFNEPLNSLGLNLDGLEIKDLNQSLLWNANALQYDDTLVLEYSASIVNQRNNTYYYEIKVIDKYDISCTIF